MNKQVRLCVLIQFFLTGAVAAQICGWMNYHKDLLGPVETPCMASLRTAPVIRYAQPSNGFYGWHIPLEPSVARLNFHTALPYRNTWMAGGYAGIDFNPYVGARGFMFKAVNFGKVKLEYETMNMYGAELRLRLPGVVGVVPSAMVGGGYLYVNRNYKARIADASTPSRCFAQGGLGLNLPLSSRFQVQCGARGMLLRHPDAGTALKVNRLYGSWMYNLGVKIVFVKKADCFN